MFSNLQLNRTLVGQNPRFMTKQGNQVSDSDMLSEWEEVQLAQKDAKHFKPLYERYYHDIFLFIHKRTGEEHISADVCSKVFFKAMEKINKYTFKGVPFSAWLYRIASNEVSQHYRTQSKKRVVSIEVNQVSDLADEMSYDFNKDNMQALLTSCLNELSESDLNIIELRFFDQKPFKEIAEILGITESNAKVKTYRITKKMKNIILKTNTKPSKK